MKKYLMPVVLFLFAVQVKGQVNLDDSIVSANIVNIDLGFGFPAADMAARFGPHATVGGGYQYKTANNWIFGLNGTYIYGYVVKEDSILDVLKNDDGFLIGTDGLLYDPILWEQGFDFKFQAGKITSLFSINTNSGLAFMGGIGFLQHNIWIYIDEQAVPQLDKEYRKGYDRLSNGLMLNQYIGYYFFSNKNFVNFRAGFDIDEAFTQNRRSYNYDTQIADDEQRFDMMITFKLSWNLPLFEKPQRKFYSY
jgi:hypothetical protein